MLKAIGRFFGAVIRDVLKSILVFAILLFLVIFIVSKLFGVNFFQLLF